MSFAKRFCRVMLCTILLLVAYILATVPLTAQIATKFRNIECESIVVTNPTDRSKMLINPSSILILNEKDEGMFLITLSKGTTPGTKGGGIIFKDKDRGVLLTTTTLAFTNVSDLESGIAPKPEIEISYNKEVNKPYIMLNTIPHDRHLTGTMIFPGGIVLKNKDGLTSLP